MRRVTKPLEQMGAIIETCEDGTPPLHIKPCDKLQAIDYAMPIASAQVKSCVLLAGLYADGTTYITEPAPTRDHTERMLRGFGYEVQTQGKQISLKGGGSLQASAIDVPADISSAAFFLVAASICPDAELTLQHVGINPTRTGVIDILRLMGAEIQLSNQREIGGEPVADLHVRYQPLHGIEIPEELVPLAIDEFPVLFVAAACAKGTTVLVVQKNCVLKKVIAFKSWRMVCKILVLLQTQPLMVSKLSVVQLLAGELIAMVIIELRWHLVLLLFVQTMPSSLMIVPMFQRHFPTLLI